MINESKAKIIALFFLGIQGCTSESGSSLEDFASEVSTAAGEISTECGTTNSLTELELNTCILDAFDNSFNAFAIYILQGVDSTPANAIVINGGNVTRYYLTSDEGNRNGAISKEECNSPLTNGTADISHLELFVCL